MKTLTRLVALALLAWLQPSFAAQHAFLVQNSGWMDPFYNDAGSQLKPLVLAVIQQATSPDDQVFIAAFNEATTGNESPSLIFKGDAGAVPQSVLSGLSIARKQSGAWADTDLNQAVKRTVTGYFNQRTGIIWIFTNNKNSPGNDPETVARNIEFYDLLHNSAHISRTLAFPVKMRLTGQRYSTSGMMVYALAYGQDSATRLADLMASGRLKVFRNAPARLKPLDQDAVLILPGQVQSKSVHARMARDGRTLVFQFNALDKPKNIVLGTRIKNLFFPYRIDTADLEAGYADLAGNNLEIAIDRTHLRSISPGQEVAANLQIEVPLSGVPSVWSPKSIAAMGEAVTVPAAIRLRLSNQQLSIDPEFTRTLQEIFPNDPLSQVFKPSDRVNSSVQTIPVTFHIQYPMTPFWIVVVGILALLAAIAYVISTVQSPRQYEFLVDGEIRSYKLRPLQTLSVQRGNVTIGTIKRRLLRTPLSISEVGHSIKLVR